MNAAGAVARLGLAAARRVGGVGGQAERVQRRDAAPAHAGGQRRQRARRAQHRATRRGQPGAVKGGEDDVGLARLGAQRADVVDGEQAGAGRQRRARVRERRAHSLRAGARERAGVGAAVHGVGAGVAGQTHQFVLGRPVPDDETAAALAQRAVEVTQGVEQELRPRPARVPSVQQAVIEAEDRHDAVVRVQGRAQRRVVAHAQVAREPDEGGHRYSRLPSGPRLRLRSSSLSPKLSRSSHHALVELHERLPEALDLLLRQRAAVDPAQRLALHELAQELDDGQHELGQAALEVLGIGVDPARERVVEPRLVAREQVEVGRCVQDAVGHCSANE